MTEEMHQNGRAAALPEEKHRPIWMVVRVGFMGSSPATFGPMPREEADAMVNSPYGGHVVCATCEHQSPNSAIAHLL